MSFETLFAKNAQGRKDRARRITNRVENRMRIHYLKTLSQRVVEGAHLPLRGVPGQTALIHIKLVG